MVILFQSDIYKSLMANSIIFMDMIKRSISLKKIKV